MRIVIDNFNCKIRRFILLCGIMSLFSICLSQSNMSNEINSILTDSKSPYEKQFKEVTEAMHKYSYQFADEKIKLCREQLLPHFLEFSKNAELRKQNLAEIYLILSDNYLYVENVSESLTAIDTLLYYADNIQNSYERAYYYRKYAERQDKIGNRKLGHEYIYKAINIYDKLGGCEKEIERCYYVIAGDYAIISEMNGLRDMKNKIKALYNKIGTNQILYDYYAVQAIYYSLFYEFELPEKNYYIDTSILYFKKAISIIENYGNELDDDVVPAWMYFNVAYLYSLKNETIFSDSITVYLNKSEKAKKGDYVDVEIELSINYLRIKKFYDEQQYELAEKEALKSLSVIVETKRNSLLPISCETYEILSGIYQKTGNSILALKYHKILLDIYKKQFNIEKTESLNEMNMKFETEKKETQIKFLEQKIAAERKLLIAITLLVISLMASIGFLIWNFKLRRENLEQAVYESALVAELQREELKQLESVKEKIQNNTAEIVAEQVKLLIEESVIPKDKKIKYIENIADMSLEIVEKINASSIEKMSMMDLKYVICFMIDMNVKDIGLLFNIYPDSVRKVHYRIRKKIGKNSYI
jgi:hypothetical protein